jgi:DNA (cytosine-5)-methyltransferase 1
MRHETARLRALDLFCGAGGGARGLQQAGFHVTGVDLAPQPRYYGDAFIQADVLDLAPQPQDCCDAFLQAVALELSIEFLRGFDFLWASPPCQAHSALRHAHNARRRDDLIAATREMLVASGRPYVIENVVGAPLRDPFLLCGTMFDLRTPCGAELRRHRIFEASFAVSEPACAHRPGAAVLGIYGGHFRNRRRPAGTNHLPQTDFSASDAHAAMGISWKMTTAEISQAIPPAYSEFIAGEWIEQL